MSGSSRSTPPFSETLHDPVVEQIIAALGGQRPPTTRHPRAETDGPPVLELVEVWQDIVVEVRHISPADPPGKGEAYTWLGEPVVDFAEGSTEILVDRRWTGWRGRGPDRVALSEVCAEGRPEGDVRVAVALLPGDRLVLRRGAARLILRLVAPGARVAGRVDGRVDLPFVGIFGSTATLAALLGVAIATSPPPVQDTAVTIPDRIAEVMLSLPPPAPQVVAEQQQAAREGKRAPEPEGRAGRKQGKRTARGDRFAKRQLDREIAEDAGVLGALADAGALGGVFDQGLSGDLTAGIGGLHGAVGVQLGTGLGLRGTGPGGGGNEIGSFSGTGTRGRGDGSVGDFEGGGDLGPRQEGMLRRSSEPIIIGGLDKSLIDAVVKRHMNQVRYCYQRALTADPGLSGKVTVQFVIARDGGVSKAKIKSSSLGSAAVESCMTDRFLRMRFPQPRGGIVIVSYPFMFSPG